MRDEFCTFDDECIRPQYRDGLCRGHYEQRRRSGRLKPLGRPTGLERLLQAALRYADAGAEDDKEFERAKDNLRKAAVAYASDEKRSA